MKKLAVLLLLAFGYLLTAHAAYLRNIPVTVTQPDGTVLHCFASGDEYFNYLHDDNGFTIMQHPKTGYYVYAEKRNGQLVASDIVVGTYDPASKGLEPYALISPEEWMARRRAWEAMDHRPKDKDYNPNHGTLNNIAIFIRFSDDGPFTNTFSSIDNMFNNVSENAVSMRSYFRSASYGSIEIPTSFYPGHDGETIISYQDIYPRSYYQPYNVVTNPNGYVEDQRAEREFGLLARAVNYVNENYPIPSDMDIDYDDDDYVDNVCFIVKGDVGGWSDLLWPHKWGLYGEQVYIHGKRVMTFNFQLADATSYFNTSTMCHEMNHSLGAPDLYHYSYSGPTAIGIWDLMDGNTNPPQHCGAYMKMKYGHWIDDIPEITQAGIYTLNPIGSPTPDNVAYKIPTSDPNQFYVLEYRDKTSLFDSGLPGSGLLIYRINTLFGGNADYDPDQGIYDEVYIFRPGGTTSETGYLDYANFSSDAGRTEFSSSTSAYPFLTDGTVDNELLIYNITSAGSTISFTYGTSSSCEAPTNLHASYESGFVSLSWDAVENAQSYNIYRNRVLIGNTSETSYDDLSVPYGVYAYSLKSVDENGILSTASEEVTLTIVPEGAVFIGGSNSASNDFLPSYSYYNYSLTHQIYTAEELGEPGMITAISLFNAGEEKTRNYDLYLKNTSKSGMYGANDWETVSAAEKVFSGSVTMKANEWNCITFDTPFLYEGNSNLLLVTDDNTGGWSNPPHMSCLVFNAPNQAIRIYSDNVNYNPADPSTYNGTILNVKNQLLVFKGTPQPVHITAVADPIEGGEVMGTGDYDFNSNCTLTATPGEDYLFLYWTCNDVIVSHASTYSFTVTNEAEYVAHFETKGIVLGEGTVTNDFLPSYSYYKHSLTQQIYTASEIGTGGYIQRLSFYNDGAEKTRDYDVYLVQTEKNVFENPNDWITVSPEDLVFSGTVTMASGQWTTLSFNEPFAYNGVSNLAVIVDDNSGNYTYAPHMSCRVYDAKCQQAIRVYSDNTDYNPFSPSEYNGTLLSVKNQIILKIDTEMDLTLGEGTATNQFLPSYSYYKYTLSQQIYTSSELTEGIITSLSFYNDGHTETRVYNIYLTHTDKTVFDNVDDWITVNEDDLVFSGTVTMNQGEWTTMVLNTPFEYDGMSNLALVVDDNTGSWTGTPHMACRVYDAQGYQSIRIYNDNVNYDPLGPVEYSGTLLSVKNQLKLCFSQHQQPDTVFQTISLSEGTNWVSFNVETTLDDLKAALVNALPGATSINIRSQNNGYSTYNGTQWRGSLNSLDPTQMYMVTVNAPCEIALEGMPMDPTAHPLTIKNGNNWIVFPCSTSMTLDDVFTGFATDGDFIRSQNNGMATYNGTQWRGSLNSLEPGQGYIYKSTSTEDKTLTFPIAE